MRGGILAAMAHRRPPRWEQLTLNAPTQDGAGPAVAADGRTWPDVRAALADLDAEGWRLAGATRDAARVRYLLRRLRP